MGQAKRRGTFEQRRAEAIERENKIKEEYQEQLSRVPAGKRDRALKVLSMMMATGMRISL